MREAVTFPISKIEFTVPKSAIDVLSPTFHHTQTQLFSPFQFGQWVRLALLGLATGELSTSGGCGNLPTNFNLPQQSGSNSGAQNFAGAGDMLRGVDPALLGTRRRLARQRICLDAGMDLHKQCLPVHAF